MVEQMDFLTERRRVNTGVCRRLSTAEGFAQWIESSAGKAIGVEFIRLAKVLKAKGCQHYGAKAVCEYIRFNRTLREGPDGFKLNNNVTSRLARWAMEQDMELKGFFETRNLKA